MNRKYSLVTRPLMNTIDSKHDKGVIKCCLVYFHFPPLFNVFHPGYVENSGKRGHPVELNAATM
jgi:hypothetical protein